MKRYDIIAIGGGAAGLVTAAGAAGLGARTALVERGRMGGECLWTGCIPSKALLAAARAVAQAREAERIGVAFGAPHIDFARVRAHVRAAQHAIEPNDSPERFRGLGVDVFEGTAAFADAATLLVNGERLSARHFVVATGSRPALPDIPGITDVPFLTNENVFEIDTLPASLLVLGGGAVGVELAQAFALLGSRVTVLEAAPRILAGEDEEMAALLHSRLQADGVTVHTNVKVQQAAPTGAGVQLTTSQGSFAAAALLIAAGRRANTDTLDLANAQVAIEANGLRVNRYLQTTTRHIWAAGDVTGAPRFTHVADYHARLVLRNALFPGRSAVDYRTVPWAIYTHPELAHVGLTEAQAREQHGSHVQVWRKPFNALDRAIADDQTAGLIKVISDRKGRILGAHMLGASASALLGEVVLAMKQNVSLPQLSSVMQAYPSYPEAIKHLGDAYVRSGFAGWKKQVASWLVHRS
jgi:pyruvate/2-oxoglutarate dehydrogenase complex dihydrolipoamide dehydrogenase (E3) component